MVALSVLTGVGSGVEEQPASTTAESARIVSFFIEWFAKLFSEKYHCLEI